MQNAIQTVTSVILACAAIACSGNPNSTMIAQPTVQQSSKNLPEQHFYQPPEVLSETRNLVTDYGVNNLDQLDDSALLQAAINDLSALPAGGKLIIPAGDYYLLEIKLKSNVQLEIQQGATIYPTFRNDGRNHRIFKFGSNNSPAIENVSVIGTGDGFRVNLAATDDNKIAVFDLGNINNFKLANFEIQDNRTIFASILVSLAKYKGNYGWPTNGVIQDARNLNAFIGYGLIQTYAADNILFDNVYSEGGVALRLETDNLMMKKTGKGGIRNIYARNVGCENGLAAVMFSPHFMDNGAVHVDGVHAKGCSFAVRIDQGYVELFSAVGQSKASWITEVETLIGQGSISHIYKRGNGDTRWAARIKGQFGDVVHAKTGLKPGSYQSSTVTGITVEAGDKAHLKQEFLRYLPCADLKKVCRPGATGSEYHGPAVAAVWDNSDGTMGSYQVDITDVTTLGFKSQQPQSVTLSTTPMCPNFSLPKACH
ncbi:hypothetical protein GCM10011369_30280 [Neiella marina]|uniref:Iota-carrageenase n=1 Tax=Neiella marina TaxID=508461 RepID=A0A8J2XRA6_9GAMM|nr:hypothetical protein [Neiella marina]GGA86167.1 hypothetical protein GCM10011369_30280 [Neiella marina]